MLFHIPRILFCTMLLALSLSAATLSVSNVTVRPRFPWDGKVDISYTLAAVKDGAGQNLPAAVVLSGRDNATGMSVDMKSLTGSYGIVATGLTHNVTWDMAADVPVGFSTPDFTVTVTAEVKMPGKYLVVDLTDGSRRFTDSEPDLNDDTCRTRELWMRAIPAGTFTMGSPEDELGRYSGPDKIYHETQHTVTLTSMFFMGIFEFTQGQYSQVGYSNGRGDPHVGAGRPRSTISYEELRGTKKLWPRSAHQIDEGEDETIVFDDGETFTERIHASFLDALRYKTGYELIFDLPTESQWEYACRAGTAGPINSGERLTDRDVNCKNLAKLARFKGTRKDGKAGYDDDPETCAKVGSYLPNAWGLYDMHGNVREWCLDWMGAYPTKSINTDPQGATSGTERVIRGGGYNGIGSRCRSADRWMNLPTEHGAGEVGFRVVCLPFAGVPVTGEDTAGSAVSAPTRLELRRSLAGKILNGDEKISACAVSSDADGVLTVDGKASAAWNAAAGTLATASLTDGWHTLTLSQGDRQYSETMVTLNSAGIRFQGGSVTSTRTWEAGAVHVLRDTVLVPEGVTLTIPAGTIVKFLPGTGILSRGQVICRGAIFTYADDDAHGGDTFMDGAGASAAAAGFLEGNFISDGLQHIAPFRHNPGIAAIPGSGDQVTQNAVAPGSRVETLLYFTAPNSEPARTMEVTFPLDRDLDLSTLEIGRIDVGDHSVTALLGQAAGAVSVPLGNGEYQLKVTASLDEAERTLTVAIRTWDDDSKDNFPPAGKDSLPAIDGVTDGFISFFCRVREDAAIGSCLSRSAAISFNGGAAKEATPAGYNLIAPEDKLPPANMLCWEAPADVACTVTIWSGSAMPGDAGAVEFGSWQVLGNSMPLPGGMMPGTTYYWQVSGADGEDAFTSPVWSFTMDRRMTINLFPGWNLISLPFTVSGDSAERLGAFQIMRLNQRGIPVKCTGFNAGSYWLFNAGDATPLLIFPADNNSTGELSLKNGWNSPAIPENGIEVDLDETPLVFDFNDNFFRQLEGDAGGKLKLEGGRGYFIYKK